MGKHMEKITNEEKEKRYKLRKQLRIIIIVLGFLTMILAIDYLCRQKILSIIFALICQIVEILLSRYRDSLEVKENNED